MPVDLNRIIQAAAEAALDQQSAPQSEQQDGNQRKPKLLTAPRALLIGAGLVTAGRVLSRARGGDLMDSLQQRLASFESELGLGKQAPEDEEFDDEEFDEDEDVEDEPHDEAEEEPEGEYDEDEPEGEYDEEEPEGEYEEDEPEGEYDEEPEAEYEDEEPEDEADEEPEPERRGSRRAGAAGRRGRG